MDKEKNRSAFERELGPSLKRNNFEYKLIQSDNEFDLSTVHFGMVSGFAAWSGYTYGIGKRIINELNSANNLEIPILVIDADFVNREIHQELFKSPCQGYFESCWVENGEILMRYGVKPELEKFLSFVKDRIRMKVSLNN